ncbi:hypothetical protein POM88_009902 [Heracleum sosnowskyi]|uniref:RNase H type-1 domain-containing protein n=1 Tax=Heracleum sosnowskyi TaxID=360622 RepID=A0AAD8N7U9_9APIA|nr:hypothetical protein POM88_009902 [Heracleum sosnowskyi]
MGDFNVAGEVADKVGGSDHAPLLLSTEPGKDGYPGFFFELKARIVDILKIPESIGKGKYLGLPAILGKNKSEMFTYILERILKKIARLESEAFIPSWSRNFNQSCGSGYSFWTPPPASLVKYNCDSAFNRDNATIGVIGRNSYGLIVDGSGCRVKASCPLLAIRVACLIVSHHNLFHAIIESDCKVAINLSTADLNPPWHSMVLVEDISLWLFDTVSLSHSCLVVMAQLTG